MTESVPLTRLPKYVDLVNGFPFRSDDFSPEGEVPLVRIRDLLEEEFSTFVPEKSVPEHARLINGDIVIGMDGDFNVRLWDRGDAALNQRLCYLRAKPNCDPRYVAYALPTQLQAINDVTPSTTVKHLSSNDILGVKIPDYSVSAQRRIADYLDRETSEIDAMTEKLNSLGEQLTHRKSVLPSNYFVKDYERVKLKWLLDEVDVRAGERAAELPLLSVSIHHGVQLRDGSLTNQNPSENLSHYKVAQPDQVVLNRMRAFQGGLGVSKWHGLVSPDYSVLQLKNDLSPSWAEFMMRTPEFVSTMTQALRGIGGVDQGNVRTPRINVRDLLELSIPLPPLEEQRRIADHLHVVTSKIDAMLAKVAELKALLTERRAALITDVVTGRKDVA